MKNREPMSDQHAKPKASKAKAQRERLIMAILQQPTLQKAAEAAGMSEVTAWRIRQTPEFQREYQQARREFMSQCYGRLQQSSTVAVSTLLRIMCDPSNSASSRVQAARSILESARGAMEIEDLEARIRELEQARQAKKVEGGNQSFGLRLPVFEQEREPDSPDSGSGTGEAGGEIRCA
jgi:hypothetical protein